MRVCVLLSCVLAAGGSGLVGPGGVVPFGGSNGPGQRVSYGRITSSQKGFFVTGSSLYAVNGLYIRAPSFPSGSRRTPLSYKDGVLCYVNQLTGWAIGIADINEHNPAKQEQETKWWLIDSSGKDRFIHEGSSLLPGCGLKWSHVTGENGEHTVKEQWDIHKETGQFKESKTKAQDGQVSVRTPSYHELPWQVVGMGSPEKLQGILNGQAHYHRLREKALGVDPLESEHGTLGKQNAGTSPPEEVDFFGRPAELSRCAGHTDDPSLSHSLREKCAHYQQPSASTFTGTLSEVANLKVKADALVCDGDSEGADSTYSSMLSTLEGGGHDKWITAQVRLLKARNLRWARSFAEAHQEILEVLNAIPTYAAALVEQGLNYLDRREFRIATRSFEQALALDRSVDQLDYFLIMARTFATRSDLALAMHGQTAGLLAGGLSSDVAQPDIKGYKHFKFEYETRDPSCTIAQLAEFRILSRGKPVIPAEVTNVGGSCPNGEGPERLADGNPSTKWLDLKKSPLVFGFEQRAVADSFSFITANDGPERDPTTFALYGAPSTGPTGWDLLVHRIDFPTPSGRLTDVGPFEFKEPVVKEEKPAPSKAKYDVQNAMRDRPNVYALLEVPVDFAFEDHLKRQFRKFSRAAHPDKNGGSNEVFQELGRASEILADPRARIQYDTGFDLDNAETQTQSYQAEEASKIKIEKEYFPERFGFFAFTDPYSHKRHVTGVGGTRAFGNVHDEIWDQPLPQQKQQTVPEMVVNEEL